MKKRFLLIISLYVYCSAYGQQTSLDFGLGSGWSYIVESRDNTVDINYSNTIAFNSGLTYQPLEFYYSLKPNFQYISSRIKGTNWETLNPVNGEISSFTLALILEKFTENSNINIGYGFGPTFTSERYIEDINFRIAEKRAFMSFILEPSLSYNISSKYKLLLSTRAIWFDPVKSFLGAEQWYIGGEDVTLLVQAGVRFKL